MHAVVPVLLLPYVPTALRRVCSGRSHPSVSTGRLAGDPPAVSKTLTRDMRYYLKGLNVRR